MQKKTKVSVIVLTYNHENTICKALDSILCQQADFPFEVIVADDASNDSTPSIIKKYKDKYPDVIMPILRNNNIGAEANFKGALEQSKGEYLAFCDGDDYWCNDRKLDIALRTLSSNTDCVMFVHDTMLNDCLKNVKSNVVNPKWKKKIKNFKFSLEDSSYTHHSARVFKNIDLPIKLMDACIYYYMLSKGFCYYYDEVMSVYNYDGKGIWSRMAKHQQLQENDQMLYELNKYFNFKFDKFYSSKARKIIYLFKLILGKEWGWKVYIKAGSYFNR